MPGAGPNTMSDTEEMREELHFSSQPPPPPPRRRLPACLLLVGCLTLVLLGQWLPVALAPRRRSAPLSSMP